MKEIRLIVKNIKDENRREKFQSAVESLAKAMYIPLTVKPRERETGEAFAYECQGDLVKQWTDYFASSLDNVYKEVTKLLDLPSVSTFSKSIKDDDWTGIPSSEAIIFRGKILFNPENGKPILRDDFRKIIKAIERFLNKRLGPADKKIVLNSISLGRVLARRLMDMPAEELQKMRLKNIHLEDKTYEWINKNESWLNKIDSRIKSEDRARLVKRYRGMQVMMDIAEESMGSKITKMTEDAVHAVRETLINGVKERKNMGAISQDLFDRFGNMNRDWGRILETEIMEATNNAFLQETVTASSPGEAIYFERIEMHDDHVCSFCEKIRGMIVRWSETPLTDENIDDKYADKAIWEGKTNMGRKAKDYWVPSAQVHPWCYSEDTEVLTDKGWMLFKDLVGGEKIMSINPETKNVGYVGYSNKTAYHYDGEMIHFTGRNYDMLVTPNHNMLYALSGDVKRGVLRSISAEELIKKPQYLLPMAVAEWEGVEPHKTIMLGDKEVPFVEYVKLWAWFLSEGNGRKRELRLAQKRIGKIKDNLPVISSILHDSVDGVYMFGEGTQLFKEMFGVKAEQKYVPDFIKELPKEYIREFLLSYMWGDGSFSIGGRGKTSFSENSREMIIRTSSPRMMADICELIVKAGWIPSVWVHNQKGEIHSFKNGDYILKTNCYNINIKRSAYRFFSNKPRICRNGKESRIPVKENYSGMVYDVELEKWHFLLTKRNGKIAWSGNCRGSWSRWYPPIKEK